MTTRKHIHHTPGARARASSRARGFTLLELILVIAIIAAGAIATAEQIVAEAEEAHADLVADNLKTIGNAVASYVSKNSSALGAAAYTNVTTAQLVTSGDLSSSFTGTPPWGGTFNIRIKRETASAPFLFTALVYTSTAWTKDGKTRLDLAGAASRKMGSAGGMTYDATGPRGTAASWSAPSATFVPAAAYAASGGQVFYNASEAILALDGIYLRRDGGNNMLAALDMNGNGVANATTVNATGLVQGGTLTSTGNINLPANGTLVSAGRMHIQAGENLYLNPWAGSADVVVGGGGGTGSLKSTGHTVLGGNLQIGASMGASAAQFTTQTGQRMQLASGGDVVIQSYRGNLHLNPWAANAGYTNPVQIGGWGSTDQLLVGGGAVTPNYSAITPTNITVSTLPGSSAKGLLARIVTMSRTTVAANNTLIAKPTCAAGGVPSVYVTTSQALGGVSGSQWGFTARAVDSGSQWTIKVEDSSGAPLTTTKLQYYQGIAYVNCEY